MPAKGVKRGTKTGRDNTVLLAQFKAHLAKGHVLRFYVDEMKGRYVDVSGTDVDEAFALAMVAFTAGRKWFMLFNPPPVDVVQMLKDEDTLRYGKRDAPAAP